MQRYAELHNGEGLFPGMVARPDPDYQPPDPVAEYFVDSNVARFMNDLEENLGSMKSSLVQLEATRSQAVVSRTENQASTREKLKDLAARIGESASRIFKMIAIVTVDLQASNKASEPPIPASPEFLGGEVKVLQVQMTKAEERINSMFLAPTNVVTVKELQGDNVLTELKSIQSVTKDIQKSVEPSNSAE